MDVINTDHHCSPAIIKKAYINRTLKWIQLETVSEMMTAAYICIKIIDIISRQMTPYLPWLMTWNAHASSLRLSGLHSLFQFLKNDEPGAISMEIGHELEQAKGVL